MMCQYPKQQLAISEVYLSVYVVLLTCHDKLAVLVTASLGSHLHS